MLESKKGQSLGAKGRHHRLRSGVVDRRGERGPLADAIESARGGRGVGLLVCTAERRSLQAWRAGVRAVRYRRRILAGETRENTMNDKRARELVARERARIERSLRELNADVTAEEELHQQQTGEASEAGTDLDREEIDLALVADLREELKAVERAEARLAAGQYGRSIDTGAEIPDERLEAAPLAERTIDEQRRLESGVG